MTFEEFENPETPDPNGNQDVNMSDFLDAVETAILALTDTPTPARLRLKQELDQAKNILKSQLDH